MQKVKKILNIRKNPVARSIGIYTFTNFFTKASSFFLLFLYTNPKYISPSENGLLSLFSTSVVFLTPFLSMGIIHSASTDYFKLNKNEFKNFFTTSLIIPFSVMISAIVVLFIFKNDLKAAYGFPEFFFWILPLLTFFNFCNEQLLSMIRNNNEPKNFFKVNFSKSVMEMSISVILVVFFAWRWEGRIAGIFLAFGTITIYAFYYFIKKGYIIGKINKKYLKSELIYAIPLITMQFGIFCMNASDKFFLSHYIKDNNETVGIYNVAWIFASVLSILCNAMLHYIFPNIYSTLSSNNINYKSIRKNFLLFISVMSCGLIGLLFFVPIAYKYFINYRYSVAMDYYYILCLGVFVWSINYFFYSFLLYYKQKKKLFGLSLFSIIVSLLLYNFFIQWWGPKGAAIANLTTYLIVFCITLLLTKSFWRKIFFEQKVETKSN